MAPADIMIDGFNPFKIIHDRLSDALHNRDEETCMVYQTEICEALIYIIRGLKKHHQERKDYAAKMKVIRELSESLLLVLTNAHAKTLASLRITGLLIGIDIMINANKIWTNRRR